MSDAPRAAKARLSFGVTAAACAVFVAAMVGASFAAVPLYRIFCQATGYNGTVRRAESAPAKILDRMVTVRFDANVGNGLGWSFRPDQREVKVKLGAIGTMAFRAENLMSQRASVKVSGIADVQVWVVQDLAVTVSGVGTVDYWGNPNVQRRASGIAKINDRGAKRAVPQ